MTNLNYDTDKILKILRKKTPNGVNDELIKKFFNSQKPVAIVNLSTAPEDLTKARVASKVASLRVAIKRICPGEIKVIKYGNDIILVRTDQLKNMGL